MRRKKTNENTNENTDLLDLSKLADAVGGEILGRMDTVKIWVDTGNLTLNHACSGKYMGGGIPVGKLIEIWGNSSSCKTLFALNFVRGVQRLGGIAVFVDVENTLNATFAKIAAHVDVDNVLVIPVEKADSLEKAFNQIHIVLRKIEEIYGIGRPIVIIYDSIAASATEREFAETTIDMFTSSKEKKKEAGAGSDKPGEHAKIIGKELRKLNPVLNRMNAAVCFINQIREKIGVMWGSPEKKASGGRSLEYYCSLSIKTRAHTKLKDDRENIKGILVNTENTKNKCFRPFIGSENMQLLFDEGINPIGGLLDSLFKGYRIDKYKKTKDKNKDESEEEIEKGEKKEKKEKSSGMWLVRPEYTEDGKEYTFKAALEKNMVPIEVLLDCPKLIDASSREEVANYLSSFGMQLDGENEFIQQTIVDGEKLDEELAG